jgi:hypothetical protein
MQQAWSSLSTRGRSFLRGAETVKQRETGPAVQRVDVPRSWVWPGFDYDNLGFNATGPEHGSTKHVSFLHSTGFSMDRPSIDKCPRVLEGRRISTSVAIQMAETRANCCTEPLLCNSQPVSRGTASSPISRSAVSSQHAPRRSLYLDTRFQGLTSMHVRACRSRLENRVVINYD